MRITFLGTGTSHGVPMIGCDCDVCRSTDPHNQRLRPSIYVEQADTHVLVDATPDFRTQALRAGLRQIDAVLITHTHADHVLGLDDLRVFCGKDRRLPVYASAESLATLERMFSYGFASEPSWATLPRFTGCAIEPDQSLTIGELVVKPLRLRHGRVSVLGFVLGDTCAYLTDCCEVPVEISERLRGIEILIIDALRYRPHPTHLTIEQALTVCDRVQPQRAFLSHLCHDVDHATLESSLPAGVRVAYDGLVVEAGT